MQRIIDAKGTYICDSHNIQQSHSSKTQSNQEPPIDPVVLNAFHEQVQAIKEGRGLPYKFKPLNYPHLETIEVE
jgi:hypothetical protein